MTATPAHVNALLAAGRQKAAAGKLDAALASFEQAAQADPQSFDAWLLVGVVHMREARPAAALEPLERAHALDPQQLDAARALADAWFQLGAPAAALPLWRQVIAARPKDLDARLKLGETCNQLGLHGAAIDVYRDGLREQPVCAELQLALAQTHEDAGRRDEAVGAYAQALQARPGWPEALAGLIGLQRAAASDLLLEQAHAQLQRRDLGDRQRALLGYALGKAHDGKGNTPLAMPLWHAANAARRRLCGPYDEARMEASVERLLQTFDAAHFARKPRATGSPDPRPVFIVGMPRSGTTLLEQILASHPQGHGCGELPEIARLVQVLGSGWPEVASELDAPWLQQGAQTWLHAATRNAPEAARRLVDKAPLNYFNVGLIADLFPRAHVIWCRRDPRDVALSIYAENMALEARFSTDLGAIAHALALHVRLMRHWQAVAPLPVHEVVYEHLVQSPEQVVRQLLEFLDLPWDPACLEFHASNRPVQTPSRWQVRQPIHGRAMGRWQRYAADLPEFAPECYPEPPGEA